MKTQSYSLSWLRLFTVLLSFSLISVFVPFIHAQWLFHKIGKSTIMIKNPEGAERQGSATGFQIEAPSGKHYTLTNAHVCGLGKDGILMLEEKLNSHRFIPKRILEVYTENDLCLVEGLDNYDALSLASNLSIGDINYSVGYPLGEEMDMTAGIIKGYLDIQIALPETPIDKCVGPHLKAENYEGYLGVFEVCTVIRPAVKSDILTYPGNSGSPMFNIYGHVTGIIFASDQQTHWGSAVSLRYITEFLKAY